MRDSLFRRFCQAVRHAPLLRSADFAWDLLRAPYHRMLNAGGNGVEVSIGGACIARIPGELSGGSLEGYEPPAVAALVNWLRAAQSPVVLDVGSAVGIVSVAALAANDRCEVFAFDPDLASLRATQRMCSHYAAERLTVIHGFVTDTHKSGRALAQASAETRDGILASGVTGDPGTTAYVCLDRAHAADIPTHSLDGLLGGHALAGRPILLKCDVEGAELLVLQGARRLIESMRPAMLLSVHPPALPAFGHSVAQVREFLMHHGYATTVLSIDHEEHWWCEPSPA